MLEPQASQDCMIMAVTTVPIMTFNYWLHAEGRDPTRKENSLGDDDGEVPVSVLQSMFKDDRAIIRRISRELGDIICKSDFWARCAFAVDYLENSAP